LELCGNFTLILGQFLIIVIYQAREMLLKLRFELLNLNFAIICLQLFDSVRNLCLNLLKHL
jgi:hypothetical protein